MIEKYKTIKISPELHTKLKIYCVKRGFKLSSWIEENLKKIYEEKREEEKC